ncbi:MAG: pyruvate dehydrogenase (acetyl-transferring) E1 component subunit alpha [Sandaracinaceae bacterium]|nr:pyruvate dehydrogenase (acetyl-transferring) E1 component subunit alpha [Sandaracinaceae bacterium]
MSVPSDRAHLLHLLHEMLRVRRLEEKSAELYTQGKIRGFLHLYVGEEAVAVGAIEALDEEDAIVATYREHGHGLLRGVSMGAILAEMYGKATGCSRGRGGSMHFFCTEKCFFGGHAIVGAGIPVAVGIALADKMRGRRRITACFFGDGATDEGAFHEALNLAALWRLPVLFLCENNQYAMGTALARHQSNIDIAAKPPTYGIPAERVDGMDVLAVERAVRYEAESVREEGKPRFLELTTYRFRAHSMFDAELYRQKAEVEEWKKRDPIARLIERGKEAGLFDDGDVEAVEREVAAELEDAVRQAEEAPFEPVEDLLRDVVTREVP